MRNLKLNMKALILLTSITLISGCKEEPKNINNISNTVVENLDENILDLEVTSTISSNTIEETKTITLSFAGDCTLGNDKKVNYFNDMVVQNNRDFSYFFSNVNDVFKNDDYTIVNLETTFTDATSYSEKTFNFKGDFDYVDILKLGNVECVNISNNHTKDYLEKGYNDTINTLESANIDYYGDDAIHVENINGVDIGIIGFKNANLNYENIDKILTQVKEKNVDYIIASCHWGEEGNYQFNANQQQIAHYLIDNGVDIVIGHHPHVLEGIEEYNGKYIVYSLGNFCFGGNKNPKDQDTMIFRQTLTYTNNSLEDTSIEIIPCSISSDKNYNDFKPTILEGEEKERVLEKIKKYSYNFNY